MESSQTLCLRQFAKKLKPGQVGARWHLKRGSRFVFLFLAILIGVPAANTLVAWTQLNVPPVIPCTLPKCDADCQAAEEARGICPRAASTMLKLTGEFPGSQSCLTVQAEWTPGPRPSAEDPDGCGPCLLEAEYSACHDTTNGMSSRGYEAGGPIARHGHSAVRYASPENSQYLGATLMLIFGGKDASENFLNDVWVYCIDKCPTIPFLRTSLNSDGLAIQQEACLEDRCRWQEKMILQDFGEWSSFFDEDRAKALRGVVPLRPAGRMGHTAVLGHVRNEEGGVTDVMTVFGGQGPNCSDFCSDLWHYDILNNRWYMLYGEWLDKDLQTRSLHNYAAFNQEAPSRRFAHSALVVDDDMFVWGGYTNGSTDACCGLDPDACFDLVRREWWISNLRQHQPFHRQLAKGRHTTQSSTIGTGVALLAVDGDRSGAINTMTNTDSQAWWQVDLGSVHHVSNITIYNAQEDISHRLQNFYVMASSKPFVSDRLNEVLQDPYVWKAHVMYLYDQVAAFQVDDDLQYVRIQLSGTDFLSLAEVEVWGYEHVESWEDLYGIKRWTELTPSRRGKAAAYPRGFHSMSMVEGRKLMVYGGYSREPPYYLNDFWLATLSDYASMVVDGVEWESVEPRPRSPPGDMLLGRYKHAAVDSQVCSLGHSKEASLPLESKKTYPGIYGETSWCQGQVVIYGGATEAAIDSAHPAHPDGFLGDLWLYNASSNVISQVHYATDVPYPARRSGHSMLLHEDSIIVYGGMGASGDCEGSVCGDVWHGTCEWGFCLCQDGFLGDLCDEQKCPNSRCSYEYQHHIYDCILCEGHGTCMTNGTCLCDPGWKGEDCSILHCPGGCSGHGSCKLGGTCDCDPGFGGEDCFDVFCPNNCTVWDDGVESGTQGDCIVLRDPPCCGTEPNCKLTEDSDLPCTERATGLEVTPPHQVSATCICADTYTGDDCGQQLADVLIRENS